MGIDEGKVCRVGEAVVLSRMVYSGPYARTYARTPTHIYPHLHVEQEDRGEERRKRAGEMHSAHLDFPSIKSLYLHDTY